MICTLWLKQNKASKQTNKQTKNGQHWSWQCSNQCPIRKTETTVDMLHRRDLIQGICYTAVGKLEKQKGGSQENQLLPLRQGEQKCTGGMNIL